MTFSPNIYRWLSARQQSNNDGATAILHLAIGLFFAEVYQYKNQQII